MEPTGWSNGFIPNAEMSIDPDQTGALDAERRDGLAGVAAMVSTLVAGILMIVKVFGWWETGSVAVLTSLVDSALDAAMSILILLAVRHSAKPADREHRYGHGKVEAVAALSQSAFLVITAVLILGECVSRLATPQPVVNETLGMLLIGGTMAVNLGLVGFQSWVIRRTNSMAIRADRAHYSGDLLIGAAVIASLFLAGDYGLAWADPAIAAAISVVLLNTAYGIGRKALDLLMDRELPDNDRERVRQIATAHPQVRGVRDLRTRSAGSDVFVQMILLVDGNLTVNAAHEIVDEVERGICAAFPSAEVLIHEEPEDLPQTLSTAQRPGSRHGDVAE
jgi:ferrous-iron efflux pump FieF